MHHAPLVKRSHGGEEIKHELRTLPVVEAPGLEAARQILPLDQIHDDETPAADPAEVGHVDEVWMSDLGPELALLNEAPDLLWGPLVIRMEHLHGHMPAGTTIGRQIDRGHGAGAQPLSELIAGAQYLAAEIEVERVRPMRFGGVVHR